MPTSAAKWAASGPIGSDCSMIRGSCLLANRRYRGDARAPNSRPATVSPVTCGAKPGSTENGCRWMQPWAAAELVEHTSKWPNPASPTAGRRVRYNRLPSSWRLPPPTRAPSRNSSRSAFHGPAGSNHRILGTDAREEGVQVGYPTLTRIIREKALISGHITAFFPVPCKRAKFVLSIMHSQAE